jgi:hypothetical protein
LLPELLQLKLDHTMGVVENARRIMCGEHWSEAAQVVGEACALLHDVGRYSQLHEYGTFQDARSIDHAKRGVEVLDKAGWLEMLPPDERTAVRVAVALHNKKEVPSSLDPLTADLVHLVRDADKLDIFRVIEKAVADDSLTRNPEIAWDLQVEGAPSREVVEAVSRGLPVSYTWIKNLSDFVLIQVGWLRGGLHFHTALRLAKERQALEFRERFLKTLSDDPGVAVCCEAARTYLSEHGVG